MLGSVRRFNFFRVAKRPKKVQVHPGRLTWNLKMMVWKMMFLFNWVIFRFHVNLPGRTLSPTYPDPSKLASF